MRRQKSMIVFLAFWTVFFICGVAYAQKGGSIKLLTYYENSALEAPIWVWNPPDPGFLTKGKSGTFVTLHIPPARGSQALIFEIDTAAAFDEAAGTNELEIAYGRHNLQAISKIIPANAVVGIAWNIVKTNILLQDGFRPALIESRFARVAKFLMYASAGTYWSMTDIDTGEELPVDEKAALIKKLIDNGFDLICSFNCRVKGVAEVRLNYYDIFIYSTDLAPYIPPAGALNILRRPQTKDGPIR